MATERMVPVGEFARDDYGITAATETAMRDYGYALLTIAGADGEVSPAELDWLIRHQRKFGAPQRIIDDYATFDHRGVDLHHLLTDIRVDVPTWSAERHLIYHAIKICRADGVYAAAERAKVTSAADILGVDRDIVLTLHAIIDMEDALTNMRKAVFHTDTTMVSPIIRAKFTRRFETLDVDGDGILQRADYEAYVDRIAAAAGYPPDSPAILRLRDHYLTLWDDLVRRAKTSTFTREQYIDALIASIVSSPQGADELFYPLVSNLVEIFDTNGDGQLDGEEFARWMIAYGITADQAAKAFRQLDKNDDRVLTHRELTSAFHEFYLSEDIDSPGNWLLGQLPFHAPSPRRH